MATLLNVGHFTQEMDLWCWAATIQMLLYYHKRRIKGEYPQGKRLESCYRQCDIVNMAPLATAVSDCCSDDGMISSNQTIKKEEIGPLLNACGLNAVFIEDILSESDLISAIDENPVLVGFQGAIGGGHVAIVDGYKDSSSGGIKFQVKDPLASFPFSSISYEKLKSYYNFGEWKWTYLVS